jgi:uncharacterized membrane protein
MKHFIKYLMLLVIGGTAYYCIEIIARGFSHWTMFVVGGICFVLIGIINEITPKMPLIWQMILSAAIITVVEFISGCILNLWLGLGIWDYSENFGNILGQICPKHTIYWFLLSSVGIVIDDYIRYFLFGEEKPKYTII